MILDTTSTKLEGVLAASVATNQPVVHVSYVVWNNDGVPTKPALFRVALNNNTDVTVLSAPTEDGHAKEIWGLWFYNLDTASVDVTFKTDDGTTERIIIRRTIPSLGTLEYNKHYGWRV